MRGGDACEGWSSLDLSELGAVQGGFWKGCLAGIVSTSIVALGIAIFNPVAGGATVLGGCIAGGNIEDAYEGQ